MQNSNLRPLPCENRMEKDALHQNCLITNILQHFANIAILSFVSENIQIIRVHGRFRWYKVVQVISYEKECPKQASYAFCKPRESHVEPLQELDTVVFQFVARFFELPDGRGKFIHRFTHRGMDRPGIQSYWVSHFADYTFYISRNPLKPCSENF